MRFQTPLLNAYRLRLLAWLVILLTAVYMFTYNGRIESNDTRTLFNATASLVQYNDLLLDKTAWYNRPSPLLPPQMYPLDQFDAEPLQVTLPAPLFWLAEKLPGIGLVHAVWLFNILVSVALAVVLFLYVLTLGYNETLAVAATLVLAFTTIIWPYSKSFFREPLAALMILLAALFIERWRSIGYRSFWRLALVILALTGAFLAKDAIILSLPALFLLAFPSIALSSRWRHPLDRAVKVALILIVSSLTIFLLASTFIPPDIWIDIYTRIGQLTRINRGELQFIHIALHSYLFSIGGSIWATSPIGLLAVPALWMLYRRRQYRYIGVVIISVGVFAVGYAVLRGQHWFGGLSWPPRFLIPVVPFLVIAALPVLEITLKQRARIWIIAVTTILLYGLWIQINAVSLDWGAYNAALPPEAGGLGEWGGGLNDLRYLRWVLIPTLWMRFPLDFAWVRSGVTLWAIICVLLVVLSAFFLWWLLTRPMPSEVKQRRWTPALGVLMLPLLVYLGLRSIYTDSLYLGSDQSLHDLLPVMQSNARPGDVMLLADDNYEPFFLNYDTVTFPRVITLPDQPGERSNPDESPQVTSANPDDLLIKDTVGFLHDIASTHDRLWLLADTGPWLPWSVRPIERFMVAHYYPIRELSTDPPDPRLRLIEYSTVPAPDPYAFRGPDHLTDLQFGSSIHLVGFNLPAGNIYKAGDALPISFYWQADTPPDQDYTIAWFLADQTGAPQVQGYDSQPDWGFSPTTSWHPGIPVWDNRALRLPADIQPGSYVLWVRLYYSDPSGGLQLLPVTGANVLQDTIGILPINIDIQP